MRKSGDRLPKNAAHDHDRILTRRHLIEDEQPDCAGQAGLLPDSVNPGHQSRNRHASFGSDLV